jgi:hypothetical protein
MTMSASAGSAAVVRWPSRNSLGSLCQKDVDDVGVGSPLMMRACVHVERVVRGRLWGLGVIALICVLSPLEHSRHPQSLSPLSSTIISTVGFESLQLSCDSRRIDNEPWHAVAIAFMDLRTPLRSSFVYRRAL